MKKLFVSIFVTAVLMANPATGFTEEKKEEKGGPKFLYTKPKKKPQGIYEIEIEANNFQGCTYDFMNYDSVRKEFTDIASYLRVDPLSSKKEEEEFRVKLSKLYTELISLGLITLKWKN